MEETDGSDSEGQDGEEQMVESNEDATEMSEDAPEMGDGAKPARPDVKDDGRAEPPYKVFTTAHDEVVGAEDLRRRRADTTARLSRPAAGQSFQRGLAPGQQAAAPAHGPAEPQLEL